jgi:hypothetical protein
MMLVGVVVTFMFEGLAVLGRLTERDSAGLIAPEPKRWLPHTLICAPNALSN